jgi:Tat protein translocase TatC
MRSATGNSAAAEKEMPFLEHLEELRWRLIKALLAVGAASALAFAFIQQIFDFLVRPYRQALTLLAATTGRPEMSQDARLVFLGPTAGFMIYIKLAMTAGIVLALPVIFYQLWKFVAPGLLLKERRVVPRFTISATLCFLAGAAFCYYLVLPYGLSFLLGFQTADLVAMITIEEYFGAHRNPDTRIPPAKAPLRDRHHLRAGRGAHPHRRRLYTTPARHPVDVALRSEHLGGEGRYAHGNARGAENH